MDDINVFSSLPEELTAVVLEYLARGTEPNPALIALVNKNMLKIFNKYRNLFRPKLKGKSF
jgi:hypothetical protein